jgi:hypothetical protein
MNLAVGLPLIITDLATHAPPIEIHTTLVLQLERKLMNLSKLCGGCVSSTPLLVSKQQAGINIAMHNALVWTLKIVHEPAFYRNAVPDCMTADYSNSDRFRNFR